MEWPEELDTATQKAMLSGHLLTWAGAVERQVGRVITARQERRRAGRRTPDPDEMTDLALLLEALRIMVVGTRSALKVADGEAKRRVQDALQRFHEFVPKVEAIRAVSTYLGRFIVSGTGKAKGFGASHRDLKFRVTIDDETFAVSEYTIVLQGVGEIPILNAPAAANELAREVFHAFKP